MRLAIPVVAAAVALSLAAGCRREPKAASLDQLITDLLGEDVTRRGQARLELIRRGEASVPPLAALVRDGAPAQRLVAANLLWALGANARPAVPELARAVRDADPELRLTAVMALENLGAAAAPGVPALVAALDDGDRRVRQAACHALAEIGPAARAALPALNRRLQRAPWPEAEEAVRRIQGRNPVPGGAP